jgi:hypothetical protein
MEGNNGRHSVATVIAFQVGEHRDALSNHYHMMR